MLKLQITIIVIISLVLVSCTSERKPRRMLLANNNLKIVDKSKVKSYQELYQTDQFINDDELLYKGSPLAFDFENMDRREKIESISYNHSGGRIAALLPLTGEFARVAESIKNAITLAVFNDPSFKQNNIQVQFYDTGSNISAARLAVEQAIRDNADVIIGPLTAASTETIYNIVESYDVPTISLSNDNRITSDNIIIFGVQPTDQIAGLLSGDYADNAIGLLLTDDFYGRNIYDYVKDSYDIRAVEFYRKGNNDSLSKAIKSLKNSYESGDYFSTVLMPINRNDARIALPLFLYNDLNLNDFIVLGNDKWDDYLLRKYRVVIPQPKNTQGVEFVDNYQQAFTTSPNFMSQIAYDAMQLAKRKIIYGSFSDGYLEQKMGVYANYYLDDNLAHRQMGKMKYNKSGRTIALAGDSFDNNDKRRAMATMDIESPSNYDYDNDYGGQSQNQGQNQQQQRSEYDQPTGYKPYYYNNRGKLY
jgi:ABC-type branched-subunit amino acid transport system substrate-binding protein